MQMQVLHLMAVQASHMGLPTWPILWSAGSLLEISLHTRQYFTAETVETVMQRISGFI